MDRRGPDSRRRRVLAPPGATALTSTTPGIGFPGGEAPRQREGRSCRGAAISDDRVGAGSRTTLRRSWPHRPDIAQQYPDPRVNFRTTMFGLTLDLYRAEWVRRQAEGWQRWELDHRLPAPGAVSA